METSTYEMYVHHCNLAIHLHLHTVCSPNQLHILSLVCLSFTGRSLMVRLTSRRGWKSSKTSNTILSSIPYLSPRLASCTNPLLKVLNVQSLLTHTLIGWRQLIWLAWCKCPDSNFSPWRLQKTSIYMIYCMMVLMLQCLFPIARKPSGLGESWEPKEVCVPPCVCVGYWNAVSLPL